MELYGYQFTRESDLTHHGIKGQKWGVRRFQNEDGSYTEEGKKHRQTAADIYGEGRHTTAEQYNRRTYDKARFGEKGYERIRTKLDKGKSYKAAIRAEKGRACVRKMAATIGTLAMLDLALNDGKGIKQNVDVAKTLAIAAKLKIGQKMAERAAWKAAHTVWDVDLQRWVRY